MQRARIEDEMSRFEAEISGGRGAPGFQQGNRGGWQGGGRGGRGGATIPPPPPPAIILNRSGGSGAAGSSNPHFRSAPSTATTSSAPTIYASAPQTNTTQSNPSDGGTAASATAAAPADDDDLDDIFASLEQTEKELKKEAKRKAKKAAALPDGVVAAKKPKMGEPVAVKPAAAAPAAKPFVPPQMQNLLIPHSTQVRMTAAAKAAKAAPAAAPKPAAQPAAAASAAGAAASTSAPTSGQAGHQSLSIKAYGGAIQNITNEDSWKKAKSKKKMVRTGGGQIWEDDTLKDWDTNDFRVFCGDLGNDVTDEVLARTFGRYPSFQKAKVIRDKKSNKTKGFGFISFKEPGDFTKAMREMNGKYVGSRPIKMRKSNWKDRNIEVVRQKQKQKQDMGYKW